MSPGKGEDGIKGAVKSALALGQTRIGVDRLFRFLNRDKLLVLMYHGVTEQEHDPPVWTQLPVALFRDQMAFLRDHYRVLSLEECLAAHNRGGRLPERSALITFDDGDHSFASQAFPVLKKYRLPVTLFLISAHLENGVYGSMQTEMIRELLKNPWITVQSHSRTHPLLSQVDDAALENELAGAKKELEDLFQAPIRAIAYPSGDMDQRVADAARKYGYTVAFTTSAKKLRGISEGPWSLTRVKISRTSDFLPAFWIKISGVYENVRRLRRSIKTRFRAEA